MTTVSELTNRALQLIRENRPDDALPLLQAVVNREPHIASAYFNLGNLLRTLGRVAEASKAHEQAIALNAALRRLIDQPSDPSAVDCETSQPLRQTLQTAQRYFAAGQLHAALQACQRALTLDPRCLEVLVTAGLILHELGELPEAESHFRRALELNPLQAGVLNKLGNVYQQLNRFDEALDCYGRAIEADEGCLAAYCSLDFLLNDQGRSEDAHRYWREAYARKADPVVRLLQATALPAVYDSVEQISQHRSRISENVRELVANGFTVSPPRLCQPSFMRRIKGTTIAICRRRWPNCSAIPSLLRAERPGAEVACDLAWRRSISVTTPLAG